MWRKEEVKSQGVSPVAAPPSSAIATPAPTPAVAPATGPVSAPLPVSPRAAACISQGIRIKGEVIGKEDLFVDGQVEGKLELAGSVVTVGPNGKVKADITAREVVVRGHVDGKIQGMERVQLWNTGRVTGEVVCERLAIEDGAVLRGQVEAGKSRSRQADGRTKSASSESNEKARNSSAAVSSAPAVI